MRNLRDETCIWTETSHNAFTLGTSSEEHMKTFIYTSFQSDELFSEVYVTQEQK